MIFFSKRAEVLKSIKNRTTITRICKESGLPILTVRSALHKFEEVGIVKLGQLNKLTYQILLTDKGTRIKCHIIEISKLCK